ncbi:MAG: flagellar export protein FliJ [Oscillospiraceae bacterium]|nr:flagellar export protein FliJ [Oscillospiraceae bacterium]
MKKFKFTLESVERYKKTVEKLQRAELKEAQNALRDAYRRDGELAESFESGRQQRAAELRGGATSAERLVAYDRFFTRVRDARAKVASEIERAALEVGKREAALLATMRELKVYKKLRGRQYAEYMTQMRAEDEKNVGDLVSFDVISEGV